MRVATPLRSDSEIQASVEAELQWTPEVDAAGIGVAVDDGVVALWGEVDNYADRLAAKRAALRVRGVGAVVDNLVVHPNSRLSVSPTDIGKEVEHALRSAVNIPDAVKAEVDGHSVVLTGQVSWDYQRQAAQRAVQYLRGVNSVNNRITLTPRASAVGTELRIKSAIIRNAQLDAKAIHVTVDGDTVTLSGKVRSWAEKRQAEAAAWSSPHVNDVRNDILVRPL
ncbi:MAG: BON domain-containing protein [Mycobacterium sp.]|nr:BON domain-containing protein [Mycobacterium sp.]